MMMEGKPREQYGAAGEDKEETGPESMRTVQTLGEDTRHRKSHGTHQPEELGERDEHSSSCALSIAQDDKAGEEESNDQAHEYNVEPEEAGSMRI